ncbi:MAG: hypothetical protein ABEJ77_02895 [Halanaeroarchaeum sp.]
MNWSHSSKGALALVLLLLVAAVPAGAVAISGDAPATVAVGEKKTTTFTITEPFDEYQQWTLEGHTELTQVSWTITTYDNADRQVEKKTVSGQSFTYALSADSGVVRVEVKLVGTVPPVTNWSYDPPQQIQYARFVQSQPGGSSDVIGSAMTARPYTQESADARDAIDQAQQAIQRAQSAGLSVGAARSDLQDAIAFYDAGKFQQAVQNAEQAEQKALNALQSKQRNRTLLLAAGAIVVGLAIAGAVYWYRQQGDSYDKLG